MEGVALEFNLYLFLLVEPKLTYFYTLEAIFKIISMVFSKISGVFLITFFIVQLGWAQNEAIDVNHYRFELALSDSTDVIGGKAGITFKALSENDAVYFDLIAANNKNGEGMKVSDVKAEGKSLNFEQKDDRIYMDLKEPVDSGDVKTVSISYKGIPKDGLIIRKNKFGHRTIFADNWPERAREWIPTNDHPSDKAKVDFVITAPAHYQVVGNGEKVEETSLLNGKRLTHWRTEKELPTKIMAIGAADFAVKRDTVIRHIPVQSWVFSKNRDEGFAQYAYSKDILQFYEDYIADFPYKKLANVQSKTRFGGLENASNIFYSEESVSLSPSKSDKRDLEALMAHETAHQWFGDDASETDWEHLWLSEGFATYLADLYMKHQHGDTLFKERLKKERKEALAFYQQQKTPIVDTVGAKDPMQLLNPNSYQKAAWVLHMLRHKLGDAEFQNGIQAYYQTYKDSNASTKDFKEVIEKGSGANLDQFFNQWLFTPGQPILKGTWHYDTKQEAVVMNLEQTQDDVFKFPLEIEMRNGDKTEVKEIRVNNKEVTKTVKVPFSPNKVRLDPNIKLFFRGQVKEEN